MNRQFIYDQIIRKQSFLCVGLDTDISRIPAHLLNKSDPVFSFNKAVIDATSDLAVAYKPNLAFYEALGPAGMESLKKTIEYIPEEIFVIADAKRGDIGNTSKYYAKAFFEYYNADAITVAPYMGSDSVMPFLNNNDKWVIVLALTSNVGSADFQKLELKDGRILFEKVTQRITEYGTADQIMLVVGATQSASIKRIRELAPDYFFLVPGIGAQGGSLKEVCESGMNSMGGLLVNSSRGIIYAGNSENFADDARIAAAAIQKEMAFYLKG